MRGLRCFTKSPLISVLSSLCEQAALKTALHLLFHTGIVDKTASCALPRATFSIHRHDPRIWILMYNIQTISCSPGRPPLAGTSARKEILQNRRTNLNKLEKTEKKTGEAFCSSLFRKTFNPNLQWGGE